MRRCNVFNKSPAVEITKTLQKFNFSQLHLIFEKLSTSSYFFKNFQNPSIFAEVERNGWGCLVCMFPTPTTSISPVS